jgi:hypothetical protein
LTIYILYVILIKYLNLKNMSEIQKAHVFPSGKEYTGEKIKLWKEALQKTINEVEKMDATTVAKKLDQYKDVIPGKESKDNTFEMIALYQRALGLLWNETKIDARFGGDTYKQLKKAQAEKLKFTETDVDGFPGPKTTKALIELLGKSQPAAPVVVAPAAAVERPAPTVSVAPVVAPAAASSASQTIRPQANPIAILDTKIDFAAEQKRALAAIGHAQEKSMIESLSWNGSFYNGSAPKLIDYAVVKQPDGELYVFDKPNQDSRTVFRMNTKNEVISSIQVDAKWAISNAKWAPMKNVSYMPTPEIKK